MCPSTGDFLRDSPARSVQKANTIKNNRKKKIMSQKTEFFTLCLTNKRECLTVKSPAKSISWCNITTPLVATAYTNCSVNGLRA